MAAAEKKRGKDVKLWLFRKIKTKIQDQQGGSAGNAFFPLNAGVLGQCISLSNASPELIQNLQQTVYSLSPGNQLIFFLSKERRFKIAEIAELTGLPVQSVENGLADVIKTLAETISWR